MNISEDPGQISLISNLFLFYNQSGWEDSKCELFAIRNPQSMQFHLIPRHFKSLCIAIVPSCSWDISRIFLPSTGLFSWIRCRHFERMAKLSRPIFH
jgi:hypothetical protein